MSAQPGNRTPVSTVGGYYDTTTPAARPYMYVESSGRSSGRKHVWVVISEEYITKLKIGVG
jgi:hypothetical protein